MYLTRRKDDGVEIASNDVLSVAMKTSLDT